LIPKYYEIGATIASVISELTVNTIMFLFVRKKVNISIPFNDLIKTTASSIIMGFYIYLIILLNMSNITTCMLSIPGGIIIFIVINNLLKNTLLIDIYNKLSIKRRRKKYE
jgi:hypothetical protein